ncbi:hypothetical protein Vadar_023089 [Vaccinium darrowii]|uniref:Uncharacterized protein n=1 Tax=Vaccinium darrowii TaxID=229202 RepID=A0ACB7XTB7_9ERIC|nr:hypothetical protein Vadar_023089 [Vaccinium darrowii]
MASTDHPPKIGSPAPTAPPARDVENRTPESGFGVLRQWRRWDLLEERVLVFTRYLLAIAILSTLYTGAQVLRQLHELFTGKQLVSPRCLALVDFLGDQIMAYFLISSASAAIPLTNFKREGRDTIFTDSSSAAISMAFFAFLVLAFSALVSGYKLSTRSYV